MPNEITTVEREPLDLNFQGIEFRYDPTVSQVIYARVSTSAGLQPIAEDTFWLDVIRYSLVAVVLAHKLRNGVPEIHVNDMIRTLSDLEHLRHLISTDVPPVSAEAAVEIEWLKAYLSMWHDEDRNAWDSERYQIINQSAVAKFASQRDAA